MLTMAPQQCLSSPPLRRLTQTTKRRNACLKRGDSCRKSKKEGAKMNTQKLIRPLASKLRYQSLLLEVFYDDEEVVLSVAEEIRLVALDLDPWEVTLEPIEKLLIAARHLDSAAELLVMAQDTDLRSEKPEVARKLVALARDLEAPKNLVAISHQLDQDIEGGEAKAYDQPRSNPIQNLNTAPTKDSSGSSEPAIYAAD